MRMAWRDVVSCLYYWNRRDARSWRCLRHTCHSCEPGISTQTCLIPAVSRASCKLLLEAYSRSSVPQPSHNKRMDWLAVAGLERLPPKDVFGSKLRPPPLKAAI